MITFISLNETKIDDPRTIQNIVSENPGATLPLVVLRGEEEVQLNVTLQSADQDGAQVGRLGIRMQGVMGDYERLNPLSAAWFGIEKTVSITMQALQNIGLLLIGQGNFKDLGGPIAIAQMSGEAAEQGRVAAFLLHGGDFHQSGFDQFVPHSHP